MLPGVNTKQSTILACKDCTKSKVRYPAKDTDTFSKGDNYAVLPSPSNVVEIFDFKHSSTVSLDASMSFTPFTR